MVSRLANLSLSPTFLTPRHHREVTLQFLKTNMLTAIFLNNAMNQ